VVLKRKTNEQRSGKKGMKIKIIFLLKKERVTEYFTILCSRHQKLSSYFWVHL